MKAMRVAIERLRSWILVLAGLLLIGILLFFGYARWRFRRMEHDLPGKLGISVQQSTTGFTFSKSEGGHTLFTLHAAKMVQYKSGGHAELHDVSITLYGADGTAADRIYGDDFEYDPGEGVVRAKGIVQIDLQGPAATGGNSASPRAGSGAGDNIVHVKTAGLVFNQKTGVANTPEKIEFRIAQAAGSARGASFDSHTGVLVLGSEVALDSNLDGAPLVLRAHHAQFDRVSRQLYLSQDVTDYNSIHSSSDQSIVYFRQDGSPYRIKSQGHVTTNGAGQKVSSQAAQVELNTRSEPLQAVFNGGVLYAAQDAVRHLDGNADSATLSFGPQSTVRHAQLRRAVSFVDQETIPPTPAQAGTRAANHPLSTTRNVTASQIDVDFMPGPDRRAVAQTILAVGGARLNIRTLYSNTPAQATGVQGDRLLVTLRNGVAVSSLRGTGHTKLVLLDTNGVKQTSTGDNLWMTFAAPAPKAHAAGALAPQQAAQLETCDQQGNVTLERQTAAKAGVSNSQPSEVTANAQRAVYSAAGELLTLTGNPRIEDASGELIAVNIQFERASGNATATGGVKATYRQADGRPAVSFGGTEPVHVVAGRARLDHEKDLITFYGEAHQDARLWQGADSISAPVLELSRSRQTLAAGGESGSGAKAVNAVLTSVGAMDAGKSAQLKTDPKITERAQPGQPSVVRVNSRSLLYSDAGNKAAFRGGVVARNAAGAIQADEIDMYFRAAGGGSPASASSGKGNGAAAGGAKQVERIVAQGDVQLEQPGRLGTGSQLVYTAQDGKFVLTGTSAAPPHLVDQERGTVTGASLIFNDRDDSVIVSGGSSKAVTQTRTPK